MAALAPKRVGESHPTGLERLDGNRQEKPRGSGASLGECLYAGRAKHSLDARRVTLGLWRLAVEDLLRLGAIGVHEVGDARHLGALVGKTHEVFALDGR